VSTVVNFIFMKTTCVPYVDVLFGSMYPRKRFNFMKRKPEVIPDGNSLKRRTYAIKQTEVDGKAE